MLQEIPSQKKMKNSIDSIPVEYFKWGSYPDHFKIEMPHTHHFAELLFFTKGGGSHEIDFNKYDIKTGTIHYLPKSVTHFLQRDQDSEGFTIAFDSDYFETNNTHKFINPLRHDNFEFNLPAHLFQNLINQSNQILFQIKQQKGYYKEKCFLLAMELLLNTLASVQQEHKKTETNELIRKFKNLVKTNYHQAHSVAWYAAALHVSPKYLSNQTNAFMGRSAKTYITDVLIQSIKRQLLHANKSIKQIAYEHHYDVSTMGKLFKKNVGYTLREYQSYHP